MSNLNVEKLVETTVQIILKYPLCDLDKTKLTRSVNNIWSEIARSYFQNTVKHKDSLNIYCWWKRNTKNFKSMVIDCLKLEQNKNQDKIRTNIIQINIKYEDLIPFIVNYPRKKFKSLFTDLLSENLQQKGIKCWLKNSYNWFNKNIKKNCPFWRGKYVCIDKECTNIFYCMIDKNFELKNNLDLVEIKINFEENYFHHSNINKKFRCCGYDRYEQGKSIMMHGINNVQSNNILHNMLRNKDEKITKIKTLSMIKKEFVDSFKLSNEVFVDAQAAKVLTDGLCYSVNNTVSGFIQEISLDPYGFFLLSDIQLEMWKIYKKSNQLSILHFDATGSIHKHINSQKKPFFYSLVFNDCKNKIIIPVCEFLSTANDQNTIAKYLNSFRKKLNHKKTDLLPDIIVTDMSRALLNAGLSEFNNCDLGYYLNWCFDMLNLKNKSNKNTINTLFYFCSTHFLKNIIKKTKSIKKSKNVKTAFIFMFTLIQNAITLEQIENYLINILNIFNSEYMDESVFNSLFFMTRSLKDRNLNCIDIELERTPEEQDRDQHFEQFLNESHSEQNEKEEKCSNFDKYFSDKLKPHYEFIENKKNIKNDMKNEFFCPNLFELLKEYLYIIPLWSGIMISKKSEKILTRLTNNPVENWFSQVKNKILNKKKKVSCSELVTLLYKKLLSLYLTFFSKSNELDKKTLKEDLKIPVETWEDKNENKRNKIKGYFYKNYDILKYGYKYHYSFEKNENLEFKNIFKNYYEQTKDNVINRKEFSDINKNESVSNSDKLNNEQNEKFDFSSEDYKMDFSHFKFDKNESKMSIEQNEIVLLNNLLLEIEQKSYDFEFIKNKLVLNQQLIKNIITKIREIIPFRFYDEQKVENNFIKLLSLSEKFIPIVCRADGNCLYNALSIIYFGSKNENLFFILKICSLFIFFEYIEFFEHVLKNLKYQFSFRKMVTSTAKQNSWGNELNLTALNILIDRQIFCFINSQGRIEYNRYKYSFIENKKEPILIGLENLHFFPILINKNEQIDNKKNKDYDFLNNKYLSSVIRKIKYY